MSDFSASGFIRQSGGISFEERGAQPSDFTQQRGFRYARIYAENPDLFSDYYPEWQSFADCFIMRRAIITISGKQECHTRSFSASDLKSYADPGFQNVKKMKIPGSDRSSIPGGKYQLTDLQVTDVGNSMTQVTISYQQYCEWELIQLTEKTPSPGEGPSE